MMQNLRQDFLPTGHTLIHRGTECIYVFMTNGVKTVLPRLSQSADPIGFKMLFAQRVVAFRTGFDGQDLENALEPTPNSRTIDRLDMGGENPPVYAKIVIEPANSRINEADHVLRATRVRFAFILGLVQFAYQLIRRPSWQTTLPQFRRDGTRASGTTGAVHRSEIRFQGNNHHGAGRFGIEP